jgi:hypothetical protein
MVGAGGLVVSASPLVIARDIEAEGAVYGGSTTGQWICGPIGRARYAGAAGIARFSEHSVHSKTGPGWTARLGAGAEAESTQIVPMDDGCGRSCNHAPPDRLLAGGSIRGGYRGRYFGIETGAAAYQGWANSGSRTPEVAPFPELELSFGKPDGGRGFLGFGTPWVTSQRRPALFYAGGAVRLDSRYELVFGTGFFRAGPATFEATAFRVDGQFRARLSDRLELRAGNAFSLDSDYGEEPGFESSLSLATEF